PRTSPASPSTTASSVPPATGTATSGSSPTSSPPGWRTRPPTPTTSAGRHRWSKRPGRCWPTRAFLPTRSSRRPSSRAETRRADAHPHPRPGQGGRRVPARAVPLRQQGGPRRLGGPDPGRNAVPGRRRGAAAGLAGGSRRRHDRRPGRPLDRGADRAPRRRAPLRRDDQRPDPVRDADDNADDPDTLEEIVARFRNRYKPPIMPSSPFMRTETELAEILMKAREKNWYGQTLEELRAGRDVIVHKAGKRKREGS